MTKHLNIESIGNSVRIGKTGPVLSNSSGKLHVNSRDVHSVVSDTWEPIEGIPAGTVDTDSYPSPRASLAFVVSGLVSPLLSTKGFLNNGDTVIFDENGNLFERINGNPPLIPIESNLIPGPANIPLVSHSDQPWLDFWINRAEYTRQNTVIESDSWMVPLADPDASPNLFLNGNLIHLDAAWPSGLGVVSPIESSFIEQNKYISTTFSFGSTEFANGDYSLVYIYFMETDFTVGNFPQLTFSTIDPTFEGQDGNYWFNYSTGDFFGPRSSGVWPPGSPISASNSIGNQTLLASSGVPTKFVGVENDYYYDLDTNLLYGPKNHNLSLTDAENWGTGEDITVLDIFYLDLWAGNSYFVIQIGRSDGSDIGLEPSSLNSLPVGDYGVNIVHQTSFGKLACITVSDPDPGVDGFLAINYGSTVDNIEGINITVEISPINGYSWRINGTQLENIYTLNPIPGFPLGFDGPHTYYKFFDGLSHGGKLDSKKSNFCFMYADNSYNLTAPFEATLFSQDASSENLGHDRFGPATTNDINVLEFLQPDVYENIDPITLDRNSVYILTNDSIVNNIDKPAGSIVAINSVNEIVPIGEETGIWDNIITLSSFLYPPLTTEVSGTGSFTSTSITPTDSGYAVLTQASTVEISGDQQGVYFNIPSTTSDPNEPIYVGFFSNEWPPSSGILISVVYYSSENARFEFSVGNPMGGSVSSPLEIPGFIPGITELCFSVDNTGPTGATCYFYADGVLLNSPGHQISGPLLTPVDRMGIYAAYGPSGVTTSFIENPTNIIPGVTAVGGLGAVGTVVDPISYPSNRNNRFFEISGIPETYTTDAGKIDNGDLVRFNSNGDLISVIKSTTRFLDNVTSDIQGQLDAISGGGGALINPWDPVAETTAAETIKITSEYISLGGEGSFTDYSITPVKRYYVAHTGSHPIAPVSTTEQGIYFTLPEITNQTILMVFEGSVYPPTGVMCYIYRQDNGKLGAYVAGSYGSDYNIDLNSLPEFPEDYVAGDELCFSMDKYGPHGVRGHLYVSGQKLTSYAPRDFLDGATAEGDDIDGFMVGFFDSGYGQVAINFSNSDPVDNVSGEETEYWINQVTSQLYGPRTNGLWGSATDLTVVTSNIIPTINGDVTLLSGSGAASGGTDGNYYYDYSNIAFYGPKENGTWPAGDFSLYKSYVNTLVYDGSFVFNINSTPTTPIDGVTVARAYSSAITGIKGYQDPIESFPTPRADKFYEVTSIPRPLDTNEGKVDIGDIVLFNSVNEVSAIFNKKSKFLDNVTDDVEAQLQRIGSIGRREWIPTEESLLSVPKMTQSGRTGFILPDDGSTYYSTKENVILAGSINGTVIPAPTEKGIYFTVDPSSLVGQAGYDTSHITVFFYNTSWTSGSPSSTPPLRMEIDTGDSENWTGGFTLYNAADTPFSGDAGAYTSLTSNIEFCITLKDDGQVKVYADGIECTPGGVTLSSFSSGFSGISVLGLIWFSGGDAWTDAFNVPIKIVESPINPITGVTQFKFLQPTGNVARSSYPDNRSNQTFYVKGLTSPLSTPIGKIDNGDLAIFDMDLELKKIVPSGALAPLIGTKRVQISELDFNYNGTIALGDALPDGTIICGVRVQVITAFDGTAPVIDIGMVGSFDSIISNTQVDLSTTGAYDNNCFVIVTSPNRKIVATVDFDSSVAGSLMILIDYIQR